MRKTFRLQLLIVLLILSACNKDEDNPIILDELTGVVQKGPFINGSSIVLSELSVSLEPIGISFNDRISDNAGGFAISSIALNSPYVELIANGFYYNEISDENSVSQLTLRALSDLTDQSSLNANILTHLEVNRVKNLVSSGEKFDDAKKQAQSELLQIFEVVKPDIINSENLDITMPGDEHAILLAISLIIQGRQSVAQLSEFLANINSDLEEDGILNNPSTGEMLINNAIVLNPAEIRANLGYRYESSGFNIYIPDFEKYVNQFIDSTDFIPTNQITYPTVYKSRTNILVDSSFVASPGIIYSIAAHLPLGTSIKIVCKPSPGYGWGATGLGNPEGLEVENNYPTSMIYTASGNDQTVNIPAMFGESAPVEPTSLDIFIYENNASDVTRVKTVRTF